MKKWLSRAIVFAMVVAMVIPTPVAAAKSSKSGGKLVNSVVTYYYDNGPDKQYGTADDKWVPVEKASYSYDKKKYPKEIKEVSYDSYFLNIPVSGSTTIKTLKYKYKGKTPKSMSEANDAGYITETRKYSKGKVVSYNGVRGLNTELREDGVAVENSTKYSGSYAYDGAGFVKGACTVDNYTEMGNNEGSKESNDVYYIVQKKGVPSYIFNYGNWTRKDASGTITEQNLGDGSGYYETYNSKGLATQFGYYDKEENKYIPFCNVQYVMKKGVVTEAILFEVVTQDDGSVKEEAGVKYQFNYGKKKISKKRYMNLINEFTSIHDCWFWY